MPNNPKPILLKQDGTPVYPVTDASLVMNLAVAAGIFWAEYGVTTATEIEEAVEEGKVVMCKRAEGTVYYLSFPLTTYTAYYFFAIVNDVVFILTLNKSTDVWNNYTRTSEITSHKVNELTGNESDTTKYPSTKAVADAIAAGKEIFWATYGTTTAAEVAAALAAGQIVMTVINATTTSILSLGLEDNTRYIFGAITGASSIRYAVLTKSNNSWTTSSAGFQLAALVTAFQSTPDNSHYPSEKLVYDAINPAVETTQPAGGFLSNVVYDLGELTGTITFALATPTNANIANAYYWTFETSATAPTITWPANITWIDGSAPTISASKHYEIMIRNGYGTYLEI